MMRNIVLTFGVMLISGCGVLNNLLDLLNPQGETGSSTLKRFESEQELKDYFADQINSRNDGFATFESLAAGPRDEDSPPSPQVPGSAPTGANGALGEDADADSGGFSGTTIQEEGVDEADVVKTDGSRLYIIDSEKLKIVDVTNPAEMGMVSEVTIEGYGREIYLYNNKVIAMTESGGGVFYIGGGIGIEPLPFGEGAADDSAVSSDGAAGDIQQDIAIAPGDYVYQRPQMSVTLIDVTTPSAPRIISSTAFDGTLSSSRLIGGVLHFVLTNYQDYYYDVMPMLGRPDVDVASVEVSDLLPKFERVDADGTETSGEVLTYENVYHPTDPDGFGVVSLVSLDVDNNASFTSVGVVAQPGLIYSSLNAMYLTDTEWNFLGNVRETTDIYKFAYRDRGAVPVATGSVPGRVLNQYSMGEFEENLRVATTVGPTFDDFFGQQVTPGSNAVYVLGEVEGALNVLGSVEGIAPRETIQSARFIGDRGYVVTFEQIDPLFTLDLSDPENPRVVGELEVPGFSTFLVPMDENHLLAVGQYIAEGNRWGTGVQLSIFDVTDFANPQRTANVVLSADTGASSEAMWNPKAFNYYADRGLIALPLSVWDFGGIIIPEPGPTPVDGGGSIGSGGTADGSTGVAETSVTKVEPNMQEAPPPVGDEPIPEPEPYVPGGFEGLVVYSVSAEGGFEELGRINSRFNDAGFYYPYFTRGVFIGENVYSVTDFGIRAAPISDVNSAPFELLTDEPIPTDGSGGGTGGGTIVVDPLPGDVVGAEPAPAPVDPSTGG